MRERDSRNGVKELLAMNLSSVPHLGQMLVRPGWLASFFGDGGLMNFPNIVIADGPMGYADVGAALEASMTSWDDFKWIRDAWGGPIVAKGVHTADDARRAVDHGAAAIVVSNHGARQLDGVAPTIRVLPEVVQAVNGQTEILLDGGIRRGSDIVKALCMGARAVLIGRAYAYGLGAGGQAGVAQGHRYPEGRRHPHHETAGLCRHQRLRRLVRGCPVRMDGPPASIRMTKGDNRWRRHAYTSAI